MSTREKYRNANEKKFERSQAAAKRKLFALAKPDFTLEKLPKLPALFKPGTPVTSLPG